MKKLFLLLVFASIMAACNEPSGEGAGNDTGKDVYNNMPDSVKNDTVTPTSY